jgi:pSer/pThr/pTyr-binding forkhead associated (FHA) protein
MEAERPFTLLVSLVGERPAKYVFDQPKVMVGRGAEADLRIEHAAVSRSQFLLERGVGSAGEPRFRITPFETTNPTLVNDRPAVEGTLTPGDQIAIGDVRLLLERKLQKAEPPKKKDEISPMRMALLGVTTLMALGVGWLVFGGGDEPDAGDLASTQTRLFADLPAVTCANPIECENRAHDAYARAKKLMAQSGADPGNYYRASLELDKASRFREQSGRPMADLAELNALSDKARGQAEAEFQDAKFRLSRAIAASDLRRCAAEATLLARIVPDPQHPYRVKLDAYRRTLPQEPK